MKITRKQYTRAQRRSIDSSGEALRALLKEYLQTLRNRNMKRMHRRDVYIALNRRWHRYVRQHTTERIPLNVDAFEQQAARIRMIENRKRFGSVAKLLLKKYWWVPATALAAGVAAGWLLKT